MSLDKALQQAVLAEPGWEPRVVAATGATSVKNDLAIL